MYSSLSPNGPLRLYHFIIMVTVVLILLSQLPSFHSLRHFNLASLLLSLAYSALVTGGCIYAGYIHHESSLAFNFSPCLATEYSTSDYAILFFHKDIYTCHQMQIICFFFLPICNQIDI